MSEDRREAHMRRYLDEVFNRHDLSRLDQYLAEDLASHWLGDRTLHGLPAWREAMAAFFAAFPDAAYTLDDMIFAGDNERSDMRGQVARDGPGLRSAYPGFHRV